MITGTCSVLDAPFFYSEGVFGVDLCYTTVNKQVQETFLALVILYMQVSAFFFSCFTGSTVAIVVSVLVAMAILTAVTTVIPGIVYVLYKKYVVVRIYHNGDTNMICLTGRNLMNQW